MVQYGTALSLISAPDSMSGKKTKLSFWPCMFITLVLLFIDDIITIEVSNSKLIYDHISTKKNGGNLKTGTLLATHMSNTGIYYYSWYSTLMSNY